MAQVLIADDSDLDRELTARAVRKAAPEVGALVTEDGEAALRGLESDPEIRLIFLDHRMPKMGAEEFLVAAAGRLENVTVILFSSAVSPMSVERCVKLGAHSYVEKPTDPSEYSVAVRQVVERYLGLSA
ncbi:MAG: response regulator [Fimbriimonas sp.]